MRCVYGFQCSMINTRLDRRLGRLHTKWKTVHKTVALLKASVQCCVGGGWRGSPSIFPEPMSPLAITLWRPRHWSLSTRLKLKMFLLCWFTPLRPPSRSLSFKAAKVLVEGLRMGGKLGWVEAEIPRSWSSWIRLKVGVVFMAGLWKKPCWWSGKVLTCSLLPEVDRLWGWKL